MLYELVCIARISNPDLIANEAKQVSTTIGRLILRNRGVIRNITSIGPKTLPKIFTKDQEAHFQGYHFMMNFDSSKAVQSEILRTLRLDPRVLRANVIKRDISKELNVKSSFDSLLEDK